MSKGQKIQTDIWKTSPKRSCHHTLEVCVCVNLIGPYTLNGKDETVMDFICLTMIDLEFGWFKIIELPNASIMCTQKGEEISEVVIDKSSVQVSRIFIKQWLN